MVQLLWKQHGATSEAETQNYHMIYQFYYWLYTQKTLKTRTQAKICTPVIKTVLFTAAKRWKTNQMSIDA